MTQGACQGRTEYFFAPHAERPQARARREAQARLICEGCPSLEECRNYARKHREYGFWGGESEDAIRRSLGRFAEGGILPKLEQGDDPFLRSLARQHFESALVAAPDLPR